MKSYALLIIPFFGWVVAQGIKFGVSLRKDGMQLKDLYASGGFPSSHTAFVVSLATIIGFREGFTSTLFAIIAAVSAVIMYDAIGVRRSSGEQAAAIEELSRSAKIPLKTTIHVSRGHTPLEVIGGIAVGIFVGIAGHVLYK